MAEFRFGANIIENLTMGMYKDPLVMFREYIQNSCDAIDKAVQGGILQDRKQGQIQIWFDQSTQSIEINDNGTGIPMQEFATIMSSIADSQKTLGDDKGFRGIGRLIGLAYCKTLIFKSKFAGESQMSILKCDAFKMRNMLVEHQSKQQSYQAQDILSQVYEFSTLPSPSVGDHFFRVELQGVDPQTKVLMDVSEVRKNLSFVAPVAYKKDFAFGQRIHDYAKGLGLSIDEYSLSIEGEEIYKGYGTVLIDRQGNEYDRVGDVIFRECKDIDGRLIAWMWVGMCKMSQQIPVRNEMRCIRLRKENIQIGDENALQKLFLEDRGHNYFVGEVFAVAKGLIPNSQRDYFNQNAMRELLESEIKRHFADLRDAYYLGSKINAAQSKVDTYQKKHQEYNKKVQEQRFASDEHRDKQERELQQAKRDADVAAIHLQRMQEKNAQQVEDTASKKVFEIIQNKQNQNVSATVDSDSGNASVSFTVVKPKPASTNFEKTKVTSKSEKEIIETIVDIIYEMLDGPVAKKLEKKIKEELKLD